LHFSESLVTDRLANRDEHLIYTLLKAMRGQTISIAFQGHHQADRYTATAPESILSLTPEETLEFNQLNWKEHLIPP
jgi:hypothetical protein